MNGWISVDNKMPKEFEFVICFGRLDNKYCVFIGWSEDSEDKNDWYCFPENTCSFYDNPEVKITHWMSLPELPKEDKKLAIIEIKEKIKWSHII